MSVLVHAQGINTVHAGGGVKKWQNSVHAVVECPPTQWKQDWVYVLKEGQNVFQNRKLWIAKAEYFKIYDTF